MPRSMPIAGPSPFPAISSSSHFPGAVAEAAAAALRGGSRRREVVAAAAGGGGVGFREGERRTRGREIL